MKKKYYTLSDAKKYVGKLQKTNDLANILNNFKDFELAIGMLARRGDENNFKRGIDRFLSLIESDGKDSMKKDAYQFLETVCMYIDNKRVLKRGDATKFLKKFYSENLKGL